MKSITQIAATFAFQSYFDSALLSNAILAQTNGNPIVDSTRQFAQNPGVGVALHPMSQSPVAIMFHGGASDSAVVHLTPGQKIMTGPFAQFEWGLPFGWLGGGPVILYVLGDERAGVDFPESHSPIIIQRQRMVIVNGNSVAAPGTPNWPLAFAWGNANRSVAGALTPQQAAPLFQIIPEHAMMQVLGALAAPIDLNLQITNPDDFDLQSPPDQAVGFSNGLHFWPFTVQAVIGPNVAAVLWIPSEVAGLAGDSAAVSILDPASVAGGTFVDVVRYGRFM